MDAQRYQFEIHFTETTPDLSYVPDTQTQQNDPVNKNRNLSIAEKYKIENKNGFFDIFLFWEIIRTKWNFGKKKLRHFPVLLLQNLSIYFSEEMDFDEIRADFSEGIFWRCVLLYFPALSEEPMFAEPIPNVTVAVGRDANLPCVINNLGSYKVITIFQEICSPDLHGQSNESFANSC